MFNGIIFNQGIVKKITKRKIGTNIFLKSNLNLKKKDIGVSIACDGVCLTLMGINSKLMEFYLSHETIQRSKFKNTRLNDSINLELPLKFGEKISGHICQGHIDCTGTVILIKKIDRSYLFELVVNKNVRMNLVEKASISINGVSLTVSKKTKKGFQTWIIPQTKLGDRQKWIALSSGYKGVIQINPGAQKALFENSASLLPIIILFSSLNLDSAREN